MTKLARQTGASRPPRRFTLIAGCAALMLGGTAGAAQTDGGAIKLNQVGFPPAAQKLAVVAGEAANAGFTVVDAATGKPVFEGRLGAAATWDASGERVRVADFSSLRTPGSYRLRVAGLPDSDPFKVSLDVYRELDAAAVRS
jgi:endoglucanase